MDTQARPRRLWRAPRPAVATGEPTPFKAPRLRKRGLWLVAIVALVISVVVASSTRHHLVHEKYPLAAAVITTVVKFPTTDGELSALFTPPPQNLAAHRLTILTMHAVVNHHVDPALPARFSTGCVPGTPLGFMRPAVTAHLAPSQLYSHKPLSFLLPPGGESANACHHGYSAAAYVPIGILSHGRQVVTGLSVRYRLDGVVATEFVQSQSTLTVYPDGTYTG